MTDHMPTTVQVLSLTISRQWQAFRSTIGIRPNALVDHWPWTGTGGLWGNGEADIHELDPNLRGFGRAKRIILGLIGCSVGARANFSFVRAKDKSRSLRDAKEESRIALEDHLCRYDGVSQGSDAAWPDWSVAAGEALDGVVQQFYRASDCRGLGPHDESRQTEVPGRPAR